MSSVVGELMVLCMKFVLKFRIRLDPTWEKQTDGVSSPLAFSGTVYTVFRFLGMLDAQAYVASVNADKRLCFLVIDMI